MRSFLEWFDEGVRDEKPWLILGKGPTFAKRTEFDLGDYHLLGLNHVVREQPVRVAHLIDIDVVDHCGEVLITNADVVVMPWVPHVNCWPTARTLQDWIETKEILRRLDERGSLLWYNLAISKVAAQRISADDLDQLVQPESPVVQARYFSAEAALNLLSLAGARCVRTLGIDGGTSYSPDFDDLKDTTLLANTLSSFDVQFQEIARTIMKTNMDFAPLDVETPIRVYVATTEAQMLAVKVLEYSIRKHASMSTAVFPLHESGIEIPTPEKLENQGRTPFSFQRFLIPQLAGYRGRAIYLDSDMQVFDDIKQVWSLPFDGAQLLAVRDPAETARRPQFSVMLLDCGSLRWDIREIVASLDRGEMTYEKLMYDMAAARGVRRSIPPRWNSLEKYSEGETALLHYTDMNTQPWIYIDHPLGHLWTQALIEAIDRGFLAEDYVREHVALGYVRPSLLWQMEHGVDDGRLLPKDARLLDKEFVAPYQSLPTVRLNRWSRPHQLIRAVLRASPIPALARRVRGRLRG